jgi:hypothetical protein
MNIPTAEQHHCRTQFDEKRNKNFLSPIVHRSIEKSQGVWFLTFDDRSNLQISRCPLCGATLV